MATLADLRVARQRAHLSLKALAQRAGISYGYLARIERAQVNPTLKVINQVSRALESQRLEADDVDDKYDAEWGERVREAWQVVREYDPKLAVARNEHKHMPWRWYRVLAATVAAEIDGGVPLSELAVMFDCSRNASYQQLRKMEEKLLVCRCRNPKDKRQRNIKSGPIGYLWLHEENNTPEEPAFGDPEAAQRFWLKSSQWMSWLTAMSSISTNATRFEAMVQGIGADLDNRFGQSLGKHGGRKSSKRHELASAILRVWPIGPRGVLRATRSKAANILKYLEDTDNIEELKAYLESDLVDAGLGGSNIFKVLRVSITPSIIEMMLIQFRSFIFQVEEMLRAVDNQIHALEQPRPHHQARRTTKSRKA